MPRKPLAKRPRAVAPETPQTLCLVCDCIAAGATPRFPMCSRCQELKPLELFRLAPEKRKAALVMLGVSAAIEFVTRRRR